MEGDTVEVQEGIPCDLDGMIVALEDDITGRYKG